MSALPPLPIPAEQWTRRWCVFTSGGRLHRVAEVAWHEDERHGEGFTVCGLGGTLLTPGVFSRLSLPRCAKCCDALGIPRGDGAPFNHGIKEPGE